MIWRIAILTVCLEAFGCGGDGGGGGDPTADADADSDADADADTDTGGDSGDVTIDDCIAESSGDDCSVCACENCVAQIGTCQGDPGCIAIRECAQQTGCVGISCYLDGHCTEAVDANGGPLGDSAGLAQLLSDCVEDAACPCETASG